MRTLNTFFTTALIFTAATVSTHAQQHSPAESAHPVSLGLEYSYVHTNLVPGCNCFGLQGGGANLSVLLRAHLFAIADFNAVQRGNITPDKYQLTQLTYTFGIRYRPLTSSRLQPFGELLAGAAHASGSLAPNNALGASPNAFAMQTGGGATLRLSSHFQIIPARLDYLFTGFHNNSSNRQNDLRFSAGVSLAIGK